MTQHSGDDKYPKEFQNVLYSINHDLLSEDGIGKNQMNPVTHFFELLESLDATTDPNANVTNSSNMTATIHNMDKPHHKKMGYYLMWKELCELYDSRTANAWLRSQINGSTYLHDATMVSYPYCWSTDAFKIAKFSLPFIERPISKPSNHLNTYVQHLIQYTWFSSNQMAGASAIPNALIPMAWYVEKDIAENKLSNIDTKEFVEEMEQQFQIYTYSINQPTRASIQSPFTNLAFFDTYYLADLVANITNPDGSPINIGLVDKIQRLYMEWIVKETKIQVLTFPILTVMLLVDEKTKAFKDDEFARYVANLNSEYGQFNIFISENVTALSTCCRLISDIKKINEAPKLACEIGKKTEMDDIGQINSFGSGNIEVGSSRVISTNFPYIAYTVTQNNSDINQALISFKAQLTNTIILSQKALVAHRNILKKFIAARSLPLYEHEFMNLDRQYCTIGIIGIADAIRILNYNYPDAKLITNNGLYTAKGKEIILSWLEQIKGLNTLAGEQHHLRFNMEQIPGEGSAVSLYRKDNITFGRKDEIISQMYSNQWYSLWSDVDFSDRIELSALLDKMTDGGAILHINFSERLTPEQMYEIIKLAATSGVIYFAINYDISVCDNNHTSIGTKRCPVCNSLITKTYTRVVGYLTPVNSWNKTRKEFDHPRRKFYRDFSEVGKNE